MKIYCLVPVHNRLVSTRKCVEDLLSQDFSSELDIVVIDDGSSDGTSEYLKMMESDTHLQRTRVLSCTGNGNWWWSKCMNEGIATFINDLKPGDGVLFMNDDVSLDSNYLSHLLETWECKGTSIVMSQLADLSENEIDIDSPIKVNKKRLEIKAVHQIVDNTDPWSISEVAPGRGTLYPAEVFIQGLRINARYLPHYLADYEFSVRACRLGYPIFVAHLAKIRTDRDWGNSKRRGGFQWRMFAPESPELLKAYWKFWRVMCPETARLILLIRLVRYRLMPSLLNVVMRNRFK